MKQFEKWQTKRQIKTIGYLNNSSAYNAGEENGWRAALEFLYVEMTGCDSTQVKDLINEELKKG